MHKADTGTAAEYAYCTDQRPNELVTRIPIWVNLIWQSLSLLDSDAQQQLRHGKHWWVVGMGSAHAATVLAEADQQGAVQLRGGWQCAGSAKMLLGVSHRKC